MTSDPAKAQDAWPPLGLSAARAPGTGSGRPPLLASEALLQGHRCVEILYQGVYYRLQATRQGKLILTK